LRDRKGKKKKLWVSLIFIWRKETEEKQIKSSPSSPI
jgi:hypothetical protein